VLPNLPITFVRINPDIDRNTLKHSREKEFVIPHLLNLPPVRNSSNVKAVNKATISMRPFERLREETYEKSFVLVKDTGSSLDFFISRLSFNKYINGRSQLARILVKQDSQVFLLEKPSMNSSLVL